MWLVDDKPKLSGPLKGRSKGGWAVLLFWILYIEVAGLKHGTLSKCGKYVQKKWHKTHSYQR